MTREETIEAARQQGPDFYLLGELRRFTDIAQATGLERDQTAMMLFVHAIGLCRPEANARVALAGFLVRQARLLDTEAVDQVIDRAKW